MISFVAAVAENSVIGKDGKLIWRIPKDLAKFKEITYGGTMIMGRKTFLSLPGILKGRKHIVLTRDRDFKVDNAQVEVVNSISDIKPYIDAEEEYYVIGGGEIFKLLLPYAKKIYLSRLHKEYEGDTFFPHINNEEWYVSNEEEIFDEASDTAFTFQILNRI